MNSFKELAQTRRSHRIYTDEPVGDEYVRTILRAALMSPTAKGLRKWRFVVTDNKEKIEDLAGIRTAGSQFLAGAPVVIAVLGEPGEQEMWVEDCSIAAVSMQYQAEESWTGFLLVPHQGQGKQGGRGYGGAKGKVYSEYSGKIFRSVPDRRRTSCR